METTFNEDIIIIPTYNEIENLRPLLAEIFSYAPETDVLKVSNPSLVSS